MKLHVPYLLGLLIILLVDAGFAFSIKPLINRINSKFKKWFIWGAMHLVSLFFIVAIGLFYAKFPDVGYKYYAWFFTLVSFLMIVYIPKILFCILTGVDVIARLLRKKKQGLFFRKISLVLCLVPFIAFVYGTFWGKYNFTLKEYNLYYQNLPKEFNGFKLIQISDIHLGSWAGNIKQMQNAVELINSQKPDLVFFTGDMVNNFYQECNGMDTVLKRIKSKHGKFAVLGNHDFGDYIKWKNPSDKKNNLDSLTSFLVRAGFRVLRNSSDSAVVDSAKIGILGVDNWGIKPFKQYGRLDLAMKHAKHFPFKILLSHDPTHWSNQVIKEPGIDLTLSGHTHGAQFGFFGWSPIAWRYKLWGGLYENKAQKLIVNVGLGFIGFSSRVGMPPEISVIHLYKKNSNK